MGEVTRLVLTGGRVVDPANGVNGPADVLIVNGRIAAVGPDLPIESGTTVIAVPRHGIVCPGFIDMHTHLREPGDEHKETVATGVAAAVAGGFTAVACMPNTNPVNDHASVTRFIRERAAQAGLARVYPVGAVTKGRDGEQLAEIGELHAAGCVAISDDGRSVANALLMRRALEYASMFGMPVVDHCEDRALAGDGVAHEGHQGTVLGLRGLPAAAEEIIAARDVVLSGLTGAAVHLAHLSTRGAVRVVRDGKSRGVAVSCEVSPHHLTLTDDALVGYDSSYKMNPPLREAADLAALIEGVKDGTVDCIATDHAPHHYDEKESEFDGAPFGVIGLETAVPVCLDRLVHAGHITFVRLVELLSVNPAAILRVPGGTLGVGVPADITVLAPELSVTVEPSAFRSRARNTPFAGWTMRGGVAATIVGGRIVYANAAADGAGAFADAMARGSDARTIAS